MNSTSTISRQISDVEDNLCAGRSLTEAIFMAAASIGDRDQVGAIQIVAQEIDNRLLAATNQLEEVREALK